MFLVCATYIFSKYVYGAPLKDKNGITIANAFQKIVNECGHETNILGRKPNKTWVDKGNHEINKIMVI